MRVNVFLNGKELALRCSFFFKLDVSSARKNERERERLYTRKNIRSVITMIKSLILYYMRFKAREWYIYGGKIYTGGALIVLKQSLADYNIYILVSCR